MPSERQVNPAAILEMGVDRWNEWRSRNRSALCNLSRQNLSQGYFFEGDFSRTNLSCANLQRACLIGADLSGADLSGADLSGAYLGDANLNGANLSNANLSNANLERADLRYTNLLGTQLTDADISTARLPSASVDPYPDVVVTLLSQSAVFAQSVVPSGASLTQTERTESQRKGQQENQQAFRASLLAKMKEQLGVRTLSPIYFSDDPQLSEQARRQAQVLRRQGTRSQSAFPARLWFRLRQAWTAE